MNLAVAGPQVRGLPCACRQHHDMEFILHFSFKYHCPCLCHLIPFLHVAQIFRLGKLIKRLIFQYLVTFASWFMM